MLKKGEAKERIEISSSQFTKKFIKNFIFNGLMIGIVIGIINELVGHFITNNIIKEIVYFALIFFTINKIHIAAIKDTFYDSYIVGDDIRKSKNNVMAFFVVIVLINIIWSTMYLLRIYTVTSSLSSWYLKYFIVESIINIVLYAIVIVFCRDAIDIECSEDYMINKNYITKKLILIIIFGIVMVVGTIFINQSNKATLQDGQTNNNSVDSNINKNDNNTISNNNIQNDTKVDTIRVTSLNEINCELPDSRGIPFPSMKKDYSKLNNEKVEINITSFDTKIQKSSIYRVNTFKDGVILSYNGKEKNYIEKFNIKGESCWKCEISSDCEFYDFIEVIDGYFVRGYTNGKYIIAKINTEGSIISQKYIEDNIVDLTLVESERNNQKGYLDVIALNNQGNVIIITYNNEGNQEKVLTTNSNNIDCKKVIEKNGYYYGIGEVSTEYYYMRNTILLFKIDSLGNEIFKYDIRKNKNFDVHSNLYIGDIAVNNKHIYITVANNMDVYAFDLNGNTVKKFGYNTNRILNQGYNSSILGVKAADEGVFIYSQTGGINNIDMISNDFSFQHRIKVSHFRFDGVTTAKSLGGTNKLLETMYLDAKVYDNSSIIIYQYKFN